MIMKKFSKKMIAVVTMFAATMMNPVNSYSNVKIDTLKYADGTEANIGPDSEDAVEETALELESWMFEPVVVNKEESLAIEAWMSEEINFNAEEKLEVESWMSEEINFNAEEKLEVEPWMSEKISLEETPLEIEAWMSDSEYFRK